MNTNEIVRALKNDAKWVEKISWANALTPGSAEFLAVSERITGAAALIDKLQALVENGQSAIDTNMRLVKVVESLQAQLAESQRRAQDARQLALKTRVCPMCEDCPDGCPVETPKDSRNIVTNADRIRSMSVDEMAEFLEAETYDSCEHTASWYTEWLRQPAKEEHHEVN